MFEGARARGYARGHVSIFDSSLALVRQVRAQNGVSNLDQHESHLSRDGASVMATIYHPERYDLSEQNITTGQGWLQNCVFQRIEIDTGRLLFSWSAIDHVPLSDGYVPPNSTEVVGSGLSAGSPWDYFHMNSIDENSDGDYLISARHANTIYKVSGADGNIIWRLGGRSSDFNFLDGLNFSSQHDARWVSTNASTNIISLFDNASNGFQSTATRSSGMIIKLDHSVTPPTASLLRSFPSPDDPNDASASQSASQGNIRLLDPENWQTSHAFANWGNRPYVTEHDSAGAIIFQANIRSDYACGPMNYRAYKVNVTTTPRDAPALYTYSRSTDSSTIYYMSWNGATEVRQWRILGRQGCDQNWTSVAIVNKNGFETKFRAGRYWEYGMVEAIGPDGNGIRNSSTQGTRTFVPSPLLAQSCNEDGCETAEEYVEPTAQVTIAEMREECPAPAGDYSQNLTDTSSSGTGGDSRSESASVSDNVAAELTMIAGKYWYWILLIGGMWLVMV